MKEFTIFSIRKASALAELYLRFKVSCPVSSKKDIKIIDSFHTKIINSFQSFRKLILFEPSEHFFLLKRKYRSLFVKKCCSQKYCKRGVQPNSKGPGRLMEPG